MNKKYNEREGTVEFQMIFFVCKRALNVATLFFRLLYERRLSLILMQPAGGLLHSRFSINISLMNELAN